MVGSVKVTKPAKAVVRDLTDPKVIQEIWSDAARVVRTEAPSVRARRRRAATV